MRNWPYRTSGDTNRSRTPNSPQYSPKPKCYITLFSMYVLFPFCSLDILQCLQPTCCQPLQPIPHSIQCSAASPVLSRASGGDTHTSLFALCQKPTDIFAIHLHTAVLGTSCGSSDQGGREGWGLWQLLGDIVRIQGCGEEIWRKQSTWKS